MVSINTVRERKRGFRVNNWLLDTGAFTEISASTSGGPRGWAWVLAGLKTQGCYEVPDRKVKTVRRGRI
jgi:hypothetical protein